MGRAGGASVAAEASSGISGPPHGQLRAPEIPSRTNQASSGAAADLTVACAVGAFASGVMLLLTALSVAVPSFTFGVTLWVRATPLAPPPWNSVASSTSSAGFGWGPVVALGVFVFVSCAVGFGFALRAYRHLRRVQESLSEGDRAHVRWALYALAGVGAALALYLLTLVAGIGMLLSPPGAFTTPTGYISGVQGGLVVLGVVLALCVFAAMLLIGVFHYRLGQVIASGQAPSSAADGSALLAVGGAFYFGVAVTVLWTSSPLTTSIDLLGGSTPETALLMLPGWIFLAAGFTLWARSYHRWAVGPLPGAGAIPDTTVPVALPTPEPRHALPVLRRPRPGRARHSIGLALALVGVTLLVYAIPSAGASFGELEHVACEPGALLADETLWTPWTLINAPYGGSASGSWTQLSADGTGWIQWTTFAYNGTTGGEATLPTWTVYRAHTEFVAGPGEDTPCASPYLVEETHPGNVIASIKILDPNATSDQGLPNQLHFSEGIGSNASSVRFNASYTGTQVSEYSNCPDGPPLRWTAVSEEVRIQIPFTLHGVSTVATIAVDALTNYTYESAVPGDYFVENLAAETSGFGSGLAFRYVPCT